MKFSVIQITLIISILNILAACAEIESLQDSNSTYKKDANHTGKAFNFLTQIHSLVPREHYASEVLGTMLL